MPLLFFTVFNSILGLSVLFPVLGPLGRELGLTETEIGAMSTSYALTQLLFSASWGRRSETRGRKKVLLVGVMGFALAFGLLALMAEIGRAGLVSHATLFVLMLLARLVGGTFASAMLPTAQAYAADLTSRENRASGMAIIGAAFGLSIIFGPVIGGVLAHFFGLTAPLWFSTAFGVLNAILVWLRLPEPPRRPASMYPPATLRNVGQRAWPLLSIAAVATFATVMMEQTMAFLVQDRLSLSETETPKWMAGALFVYGVVAVIVQGGIVRRLRVAPTRLMMLGMPLTVAGLLTVMLSHSYAWMVLGMALQGLGQGLALPGTTSALSLAVTEDEQGAIAGLNNSALGLGRLFGPLVGTSLYELHDTLPFGAGAALISMVFLFVIGSPQIRAIAKRHQHARELRTSSG